MRAYELWGRGIEQLRLVQRGAPRPGPHEVLIRMCAAALNARDLQIMAGRYPIEKPLPIVPLSDGVGEVIEVGAQVTRARAGQRVAGIFAQSWLDGARTPASWSSTLAGDLDGMLQELRVLHEDGIVQVPQHLTDAEAATLPTAAVTAWQALVKSAGVKAGDRVLVRGTGGVALFAVQFAQLAGARAIVTSRGLAKQARALAAGASHLVDSTADNWVAKVRALTDGDGVDHVVDLTGDLESSIACLRTGGSICQIGYLARLRVEADLIPLLFSNLRLYAITVGPRSTFEEMNRAIAMHQLRPIVGAVIPFERAAEAWPAFASDKRFGKVVVSF